MDQQEAESVESQDGIVLTSVYQLLFQSDKGTETHRRNTGAVPSGDSCCILTHQKGRRH